MIYRILQISSTLSYVFLGGKGKFFFFHIKDVASLAQFLLHVRTLVLQRHVTTADLLAPCVGVLLCVVGRRDEGKGLGTLKPFGSCGSWV